MNTIDAKTLAVMFSTPEASDIAWSLLEQSIGARTVIIAPKELAMDDWVKRATRHCRDRTVRYLYAHTLDKPIEILALADELCVIANEQTLGQSFDLKLSEGAEDLLWLALELGVDAKYFRVDRVQLGNLAASLKARGVPARVAARRSERLVFTRQLKEIRLSNDYCSSGLWNEEGKMLGYDLLDLPFPLVRRIAAWQRDFDDTVMPPAEGSSEWWERHAEDAIEIAQALQVAVGSQVAVKLYHQNRWITVDQVDRAKGDEP